MHQRPMPLRQYFLSDVDDVVEVADGAEVAKEAASAPVAARPENPDGLVRWLLHAHTITKAIGGSQSRDFCTQTFADLVPSVLSVVKA